MGASAASAQPGRSRLRRYRTGCKPCEPRRRRCNGSLKKYVSPPSSAAARFGSSSHTPTGAARATRARSASARTGRPEDFRPGRPGLARWPAAGPISQVRELSVAPTARELRLAVLVPSRSSTAGPCCCSSSNSGVSAHPPRTPPLNAKQRTLGGRPRRSFLRLYARDASGRRRRSRPSRMPVFPGRPGNSYFLQVPHIVDVPGVVSIGIRHPQGSNAATVSRNECDGCHARIRRHQGLRVRM